MKMDKYLNTVLFILGSTVLHLSFSEELFMQIIAPERSATRRILNSAIYRAIGGVNGGRRNPLRRAGYNLEGGIKYTDNQYPTPEELSNVFCEEIFERNASVIMSINYDQLTLRSNQYTLDLAQSLGYPVISWDPHYPAALESDTDNMVLQLAPTIYHECKAIVLLLERYNWTEFSIVTTRDTGQDFIDCMAQMVKETSIQQGYLSKPRFVNIATVIIEFDEPVYYLDDAQTQYVKSQLKTLVRAKSRIILFHARKLDTDNIIEVAEDMGLTGPEFGWILTSVCIGDLSNSRSTGLPNGFLAVSQNRTVEQVEESIETSINIWSEAVKAMIKEGVPASTELTPKHNCNDDILPWSGGKTIYKYMKEVVVKETGGKQPISFTDNGVIEHVTLNLLNVRAGVPTIRRGRIRQNKNWDLVGRIYPKVVNKALEMKIETNEIVWPGQQVTPPIGRPEKRFFRIVTKEEEPFMMYVPPGEDGGCGHHAVPCVVNTQSLNLNESDSGNGTIDYCCTGLCVEILKLIADRLHFDYVLYDVPDGQWGVIDNLPDESCKTCSKSGLINDTDAKDWNGLIKEIGIDRADMILSAFIINQIRSTAVDFSVPFLESGITIMVSIRKGAISPYAFLEPYDFYSWILILIFSVHATGASIFIFEWLSPSGLAQGHASTVEHKFSLFRSFWLIWAMLFGAAVSIDVPRGVSSRFLANVWALFALVFLASYTANLAAFMITIDEYYDLSGIEDWRLLNPTKLTPHFKFSTIMNSSTDVNLNINYPRMHKYMMKYSQPDVATAKLALKNHSIHAFIYDANVLEYMAGRDEACNLLTVGRWYATSGYGIGFKRGSPLVDEVNEVILSLQHNGETERLQAFWLSGACHAKKDKKDKTSNKIGILNFISAFILLAAGVLLGVLLLALEHLYFKSGRKCLKKYDKCGCCALVSLSMGKSLTFEQSVFEAIDIQRKHKCKEPMCEMQLWKARHQLDMALLKMKEMQNDLDLALAIQSEPSYDADTADVDIETFA